MAQTPPFIWQGNKYSIVSAELIRSRSVATSISQSRQIVESIGSRWQFRVVFTSTRSNFGPQLVAHRNAMGASKTFDFLVPQPPGIVGADGNPYRPDDQLITFEALRPGVTRALMFDPPRDGVLWAGTYFKFRNHSKIYQVTETANITRVPEAAPGVPPLQFIPNPTARRHPMGSGASLWLMHFTPELQVPVPRDHHIPFSGNLMMRARYSPNGTFAHTWQQGDLTKADILIEEAV